MTAGKNDEIKRLTQALAVLREKLEEVLRVVPNLKQINDLSEIPGEKSKVVEDLLWSIYGYAEFPIHWMMQELRGKVTKVKGTGTVRFHDDVYKLYQEKIQKLLRVSQVTSHINKELREKFDCDVDACWAALHSGEIKIKQVAMVTAYRNGLEAWLKVLFKALLQANSPFPAGSGKNSESAELFFGSDKYLPIKRAINAAFHAAEAYGDVLDGEVHDRWDEVMCGRSDAREVMSAFYFQPDNWHANFKEVEPIFTTQNMPTRIENRIQEIHFSYTFGNWMAVAALCRSLLEFMIHDPKSKLGLKPKDLNDMKTDRQLPLLDIIDGLKIPAATRGDMHYIRKCGNRIMHWQKSNIEDLRPKQQADAKKCLRKIRKIISALY